MPLNRFAIEGLDHAKFGALIKEWARNPGQRPKTIEEFKQQVEAKDIEVLWPHGPNTLTELNIFDGLPERLDIRLPPVSFIKESEDYLKVEDNEYPLPKYYSEIFGGVDPQIDDSNAFHNARIGDYTVANCA